MPLISSLGRQKQVDFYELETKLVCRVSFSTSKVYIKKPCLKKKKKKEKKSWGPRIFNGQCWNSFCITIKEY